MDFPRVVFFKKVFRVITKQWIEEAKPDEFRTGGQRDAEHYYQDLRKDPKT
jgi:hypothetical protein